METLLSHRLVCAIEMAKKAGAILLENHGKMHALEWKERGHFRIIVDEMVDQYLSQAITERFPGESIYSEELDDRIHHSEWKWVVDPLDGTIPYTYGIVDHFSVCIGLVRGVTPVMGVIYAPKLGELYTAIEGGGAFCNNQPIHVDPEIALGKALMSLCTRDQHHFQRLLDRSNGIMDLIWTACASIGLAFTARGRLHAALADKLKPWDMAAAVCILREAGGRVTNLQGQEWELGDSSIIAAHPELHRRIMSRLERSEK